MEKLDELLNHIILFDGVCNLCNSSVQFIIKRDHKAKFRFASLQSVYGQEQLQKYQLSTTDMNSFVYIKAGKAFTESTAGLLVLKDLGSFWKPVYFLIVFPKPLRDWVYNRIAKNRYRMFGKKESCMVPTAELKSRFLA